MPMITSTMKVIIWLSLSVQPGEHGSFIRREPSTQSCLVPDNGTIHVGVTLFANVSIRRNDGLPFKLISLDIAEYSDCSTSIESLTLIGNKSDGTSITDELEVDGLFDGNGGIDDFQNYILNWEDIVKLEFYTPVLGFAFDNVALESIPEPTTLMLLGFGGLLMRRRITV